MFLFITFEGGEGSGKTTQARALKRRLSRRGIPTILTHEPGGTSLGRGLRHWLKHTQELSPYTELLLFVASRAQLVAQVINPGLENGFVILCDRYADSTIVYQGFGRGIELTLIQDLNDLATQGLKPHLTILSDVPAEEGLRRKGSDRLDRFEREELAFHRRIREGYLKIASAEPNRWLIVDGLLPRKKIEEIIWRRVKENLENYPNVKDKGMEKD